MWMVQNMLKLNTGKTEIILFGFKKQLAETLVPCYNGFPCK